MCESPTVPRQSLPPAAAMAVCAAQLLEGIMEYATLGNTGLLVSKLCFGTMTFGDGRGLFKAISAVGQAGADELVKTSIDGGINFFERNEGL